MLFESIASRFSSKLLTLIFLLFIGVLNSQPTRAHLLNMTEARISIDKYNALKFSMDIDIARAFDNRLDYFAASQFEQPLNQALIQNLLQDIFLSIEITIVNSWGDEIISSLDAWQVTDFIFLEQSKRAYIDPLSWPKVRIVAESKTALNHRPRTMFARFKSDFVFEEPIALTLEDLSASKTKTRWLMAYQRSPSLLLTSEESGEGLAAIEPRDVFREARVWFYFSQGVKHVVPVGLDHMLFVLALALTYFGFRSLLLMVSTFTLAHGITLLISAYGIVRIPAVVVEPVIAFSIAWAGWRLARFREVGKPNYLLIFLFGLFHGLGFAGVFSKLGLPGSGALWALLGFNLGIECAQVFIMVSGVCMMWMVMRLRFKIAVVRLVTGSLLAAGGMVWCVLRVSL